MLKKSHAHTRNFIGGANSELAPPPKKEEARFCYFSALSSVWWHRDTHTKKKSSAGKQLLVKFAFQRRQKSIQKTLGIVIKECNALHELFTHCTNTFKKELKHKKLALCLAQSEIHLEWQTRDDSSSNLRWKKKVSPFLTPGCRLCKPEKNPTELRSGFQTKQKTINTTPASIEARDLHTQPRGSRNNKC